MHLANARRPPRQVRIGNRIYDATNSTQETELILVAQRAENALSRVRELDPSWQAAPSLSDPQSASGAIAAYRSLAQQAEGRATVLERGGVPLGFNTTRDFENFGRATRDGLAIAGQSDAETYIRGSAVTGYSYRTGEAFDVGRPSDYDMAIVSPRLLQRAQELGIPLRGSGTRTGPLTEDQLGILGLKDVLKQLGTKSGRDVGFVIFRSKVEMDLRGPNLPLP